MGGGRMIIIIEGPDGAGKTTLAEKISRQTKYPIIHQSQPKSEEEKKRMLGEYIQIIRSNKNAIFDRCWYSEMAYGPVMRGESAISYPGMYELEELLARSGAILIYATGPKALLWQRCQRRGEEYVTSRDNFNAICDNYDTIMNVPHLIPVTTYGYKDL